MSRVYRGGLIGAGFFAQNHLHGWGDVEGAEIVAVCDLNPAETGATSIVDISYASLRDPDPFPQTLGEIEGKIGSILIEPGERLRVHGRSGTRTSEVKDDGRAWTSRPWRQIQDSVVHTQAHSA